MKLVSSKKRLLSAAGFLVAFAVVLNLSTFLLYAKAKQYLDVELGERLRSVALALSHTIEIAAEDLSVGSGVDPALQTVLRSTKAENLLSNIVILTPNGNTVLDLSNVSVEGEPNPFIELDLTAVTLARSGLSAYTSSYKSGNDYMKSAYAPIMSPKNDVVGILGVEAGATYFDVLRALSGAIVAIDVTSVGVLLVLGFIFYRQSLSLDRAQAAVIQGENLSTMGRMVAGIAHEIRNPLNIIATSAERLRKRYNRDDPVFSYITEEVQKLDEILTGYLDFAKARSQERRPYSVQRIARRCLMILDGDLKARHIQVVCDLLPGDIMISCDDKRIQQAILNVLLNAIQAVSTGGRIEISVKATAKYATVVIKDNGGGIPERLLKDVTRPFFTTKERGSGLGLSVVRTIIEEHHGTLDIKSVPSSGAEISLTIPVASKTTIG